MGDFCLICSESLDLEVYLCGTQNCSYNYCVCIWVCGVITQVMQKCLSQPTSLSYLFPWFICSLLSLTEHMDLDLSGHTLKFPSGSPCLEDSSIGYTSAWVLCNRLGTQLALGWQMLASGMQNTFNFIECIKQFLPEFPQVTQFSPESSFTSKLLQK